MSVIDGGLRYILGKQAKTGEFPVTGPVHNYELLVSRFIFCTELCTCYMLHVYHVFMTFTEREEQCSPHCIHCCCYEGICGHIW